MAGLRLMLTTHEINTAIQNHFGSTKDSAWGKKRVDFSDPSNDKTCVYYYFNRKKQAVIVSAPLATSKSDEESVFQPSYTEVSTKIKEQLEGEQFSISATLIGQGATKLHFMATHEDKNGNMLAFDSKSISNRRFFESSKPLSLFATIWGAMSSLWRAAWSFFYDKERINYINLRKDIIIQRLRTQSILNNEDGGHHALGTVLQMVKTIDEGETDVALDFICNEVKRTKNHHASIATELLTKNPSSPKSARLLSKLSHDNSKKASQSSRKSSSLPRQVSQSTESLSPLQQVLKEHDPDSLVIECPCLDRRYNTGRQQFEAKMLEIAQKKQSDDITLLILGSGNMGQSFHVCQKLMEQGKNVNMVLVEPRFASKLEEGHESRILTPKDFELFDKIADELSKKMGKECRIVGKFSTLSAYFIHLLAINDRLDNKDNKACDSFISKLLSFYESNEHYRDLSTKADYFADGAHQHLNADNIRSLLGSLGFSGSFTKDPLCPDIISAIDIGADCEQLTKELRNLAYFITEKIYPKALLPDSVITWTTDRSFSEGFWKTDSTMEVIEKNKLNDLDNTSIQLAF
jgi:hypothetical protein